MPNLACKVLLTVWRHCRAQIYTPPAAAQSTLEPAEEISLRVGEVYPCEEQSGEAISIGGAGIMPVIPTDRRDTCSTKDGAPVFPPHGLVGRAVSAGS